MILKNTWKRSSKHHFSILTYTQSFTHKYPQMRLKSGLASPRTRSCRSAKACYSCALSTRMAGYNNVTRADHAATQNAVFNISSTCLGEGNLVKENERLKTHIDFLPAPFLCRQFSSLCFTPPRARSLAIRYLQQTTHQQYQDRRFTPSFA